MKRIIIVFLILILLLNTAVFVGCDVKDTTVNIGVETKDNETTSEIIETNQNAGNTTNAEAVLRCERISNLNTYTVVQSDNDDQIVDKFFDGRYNYFYFKLGEIKNVPIFTSNISNHHSENHTITISNSNEVASMLQRTTNICVSEGITNTFSKTTQCSGSLGNLKANMPQVTVTQGITNSDSVSFNSSIGKTFTNSVTESMTNSASNAFSLSETDMAGKYMFVKMADFEVYAVLVCDTFDKVYYYDYLTSVKTSSVQDGWYYGTTNEEMDIIKNIDDSSNTLSFDQSIIESLDLYTSVEETRLLSCIKVAKAEENHVKWSYGRQYYYDCSALYNSDVVKYGDVGKVHITAKIDLNSYSGKTACIIKICAQGEEHVLKETSFTLNGEEIGYTVTCEMSYEDYIACFLSDKKVYVNYYADKGSYFDILDNDYYVKNFELTVEFIK